MKSYTVYMTHKMRSVQEVVANSAEEAREKAYEQSFEDENWEEQDTIYDKVVAGSEVE